MKTATPRRSLTHSRSIRHPRVLCRRQFLSDQPDLVKRMAAEGHIVGNHTWSHPDMSKISTQEAFSEELNRVSTLYQETTGQEMVKFYRPPQGKYSTQNLQMAKDLGYQTFFWSLAYVDWYQDQQPTHEEAFEKLTRTHSSRRHRSSS